ncbi:unnamed protein product [Pleuronectes platessa]|uniref:PDZ and LIM domain-containing protein n=1 Tax=Pleuronectes platessa TaxID=8262 RepID=A0A9N7TWC4_PLEPL|nr:unnamed protein product [Pleuronectes platessa]
MSKPVFGLFVVTSFPALLGCQRAGEWTGSLGALTAGHPHSASARLTLLPERHPGPGPGSHKGLNFRPISSGYGGYSRKPSYTPEPQSPPAPPAPQPTYVNNGHSRPNNGHSYGYGNGHTQYNNPTGLYAGSNGDKYLPSKMGGLNLSASHSPEPLMQPPMQPPMQRPMHSPVQLPMQPPMQSPLQPPLHSPGGHNGFNPQSDVYKMLQDYEEPVSEPKQSGSFKYLQGILEAEDGGRDYCAALHTMLLFAGTGKHP